jgi:hypothetical protein
MRKLRKFYKDLRSVLSSANIRLLAVISFIIVIGLSIFLSLNKPQENIGYFDINSPVYSSDNVVEDFNITANEDDDIIQIKYQLTKPLTYYTSCFIFDKDMNVIEDGTFCSAPVINNIGVIKMHYSKEFILVFNNDQDESLFYFVSTETIARHETRLTVEMLDDNFLTNKLAKDEIDYVKNEDNAMRYKAEIEVYAFAINDLKREVNSLKYQYRNRDKNDTVKAESLITSINDTEAEIERLRKECWKLYGDIMKILGLKI